MNNAKPPAAMKRDQLMAWYGRHGFEGTRRKMTRKARIKVLQVNQAAG